jgi:subtilase family serine protease
VFVTIRRMGVTVCAWLVLCSVLGFQALGIGAAAVPGSSTTRGLCVRGAGLGSCMAQMRLDSSGGPLVSAIPQGYGPAVFHTSYGAAALASSSVTIGIVVAYDNPRALEDLDYYSRTFGIPSIGACGATRVSSCLDKRDQRGGHSYPRVDAGWALESSMDVQIAHAMCQNCRILLVEADTSSMASLMSAVDTAVRLGANIVSNSYGGGEFSQESTYDKHFRASSVSFLASSGDSGYGVSYPAASSDVIAVGGTSLVATTSGRISERAWSGSGSGCSRYEPKPSWQHDSGCTHRSIADISANADPATGAAVYSSTSYMGRTGWFTLGGTSLSSPLVAGMMAVSGAHGGPGASRIYAKAHSYDITSGSNGSCPVVISYLCRSAVGYDGPTGIGAPMGSASF